MYIGESSRSSNERGGEHKADYTKEKTDSHQYKHVQSDHDGQVPPTFEFRVLAKFNSALTRQISEAVMIRRREGKILNSKGVYNRCKLPRLTLEDQPKQDRTETTMKFGTDVTLNWQKQGDRRKRKNETRQGQAKKVKIDMEVASQPRQEGYEKRKTYEDKNEFESLCKRMRPEFDPENEYENHLEVSQAVREAKLPKSKSNPIIFFSIFSKSNKKLNHEVMFKPSAKLKSIQSKRKQKRKEPSLTSLGGTNQSIKDYFKPGGSKPTKILSQGGEESQSLSPKKLIEAVRSQERSARGQQGEVLLIGPDHSNLLSTSSAPIV